MYWILVYVTGIPPLEAQMLRSRGDRYRDYQSRTSAFFPLPQRAVSGSGDRFRGNAERVARNRNEGSGHMSFASTIIGTAERVPLPDVIIRAAIHRLCSRTATRLATGNAESDAWFADEMAARAIAEYADEANARHHEAPAAFFAQVLGPNRKYSSCFYKEPACDAAGGRGRGAAPDRRARRSRRRPIDPRTRLRLGFAVAVDGAAIPAFAGDQRFRTRIRSANISRAKPHRRGLTNLRVVTQDMNVFDPQAQFDRIVSVEMFEHMMNWRELMTRVRSWLKPDGRFFLHIFTHRSGAYLFDRADGEDWIAQHFFTGGVMPSHHLIRQYADLFEVEKEWRWSGTHYQRTAQDWLDNFDAHRDEIEARPSRGPWQRDRVVDAALALVLSRHRRPVRLRRWQRMGRQPLPAEGGVVPMLICAARLAMLRAAERRGSIDSRNLNGGMEPAHNRVSRKNPANSAR